MRSGSAIYIAVKECEVKCGLLMLVALLQLAPCRTSAQLSQPARSEFPHENGDHGFTLVSLKENGIGLIRQKQKSEGSKNVWEIFQLDTALVQTWTTKLFLDNRLQLIGYEYVPGELYFLFRQGESNQGDLHLVRIYLFAHTLEEYDIAPKLEFRLTHFIITGNSAVLGGYMTRQSTVFLFEMGPNRIKVIPGFFVDNTELLEVKGNRNKTFNVLMIERGTREKKLLLLRTFDETGTLLLEDDIEIDPRKSILSGTTSALENDELLIAGTWGVGTGKQSAGFFAALVDPFNKQQIRYYDFGELQHFMDYLPAKKVTKIKDKADRRRHSQKPPYYRMDVHLVKLEENTKGFQLLAELYIPAMASNYYSPYSTNPYYAGNPYGYSPYGFNPMMNRNYVSPYYSSPYSYYNSPYGSSTRNADVTVIHSSLVNFDRLGKLKGDQGLPINEVKLQTLDQVSDFCPSDKLVQFYKKEKDIFASRYLEDKDTTEQETAKIKMNSDQDIIRNEAEDQGGIRYWFGSYAYAWGYETIKNKTEHSVDQVRYVYYVNKIKLE